MLNSKVRKTIITLAAAVGFLFTGTPIATAAVPVGCNAARQPCGAPCSVSDANCWSAASVTCPPDRRLGLELLRAQWTLAAESKTVAVQHARVVRQERKLRHQARLIRRLRRELAAS